MTNPVQDIYDDMAQRCDNILIMTRVGLPVDEPVSAVGILVVDDDSGVLLAIEAGIDDSGMATVTLRSFDGDCEPITPSLMELGRSVMITTR